MIFTIVSVCVAIGWCIVLRRLSKSFTTDIFKARNRGLLVAIITGCTANTAELIWLALEWYRPPISFSESCEFMVYSGVGAVCSVVTLFVLLFSPGRKDVPKTERGVMISFSMVTGIVALLMFPLSVVFS